MYKCAKCKKSIEIDLSNIGIRCPYCGHKIVYKERGSGLVKKVKAH